MSTKTSSIIVDSNYTYREEWRVRVGARHRGVANKATQCGIVNAIHEQYPELKFVSVGKQTIRFQDPATDEYLTFSTPRNALRYQTDHDKNAEDLPDIVIVLRREEADIRPVEHRIVTQRTRKPTTANSKPAKRKSRRRER